MSPCQHKQFAWISNTGKEKTSEESLNPREVYQHYTKQGKSVIPAHASTNTERERSRNASVEGY